MLGLGLGKTGRLTCVVDSNDDSFVFSDCQACLLQHVELQPFGQLVNSSVQAHHFKYRSSTKTLVALSGYWLSNLQQVISQGVSITNVVKAFQQAVELCISNLHCIELEEALNSTGDTSSQKQNQETSLPNQESQESNSNLLEPQGLCASNTKRDKTERTQSSPQDSDEDIAWYFQDGTAPDTFSADEEVLNLVEKVQGLFERYKPELIGDEVADAKNHRQHPTTEHWLKEGSLPFSETTDAKVPSLHDKKTENEEEDEFEDCFSEKNEVINKEDKILTGSKHSSGLQLSSLATNSDSTDDEFDSCFENSGTRSKTGPSCNSSYAETLAGLNTTSRPETTSSSWLQTDKKVSELPETTTKSTNIVSTSLVLPDVSLREILAKKKASVTVGSSVLNRSRHYRNLKSAVKEMSEEHTRPSLQQTATTNLPESVSHPDKKFLMSAGFVNVTDVTLSQTSMSPEMKNAPAAKQDSFSKDWESPNDRLLKLSSDCDSEDVGKGSLKKTTDKSSDIFDIARGLSRGHTELMHLVLEALKRQSHHTDTGTRPSLNLSQLHTVSIPGPSPQWTQLVDGLLIESETAQTMYWPETDKKHRALLISGDVKATFRHRGHKQEQKCQHLDTHPGQVGQEGSSWLMEVTEILKKLKVSLLLTKGTIDSSLLDYCESHSIQSCSGVAYSTLQAVAETTGSPIATYITECTREDVAEDVQVKPLTDNHLFQMKGNISRKMYLSITVPNCSVQTIVICHPCLAMCDVREEQTWHCAYRLHNTLKCGRVLKGGGATEQQCVSILHMEADRLLGLSSPEYQYHPIVYKAVAQGFLQYLQALPHHSFAVSDSVSARTANSETPNKEEWKSFSGSTVESQGEEMYDDYVGKTESWRSARDLVCQILQCDFEINTSGVMDRRDREAGSLGRVMAVL